MPKHKISDANKENVICKGLYSMFLADDDEESRKAVSMEEPSELVAMTRKLTDMHESMNKEIKEKTEMMDEEIKKMKKMNEMINERIKNMEKMSEMIDGMIHKMKLKK